ncbi:hypothetical protein T4D_10265 [Trichinella pseudospiralis]|uniref:Uncharacterized protein n=1 Tax=Trichinella pseudospiralis TaxID=6337 RepID=A0A0V1G3F0_TRIPS|nr:hypothetical protein T4D_10265 [Trichinella pseudospiralis]
MVFALVAYRNMRKGYRIYSHGFLHIIPVAAFYRVCSVLDIGILWHTMLFASNPIKLYVDS